MTARPLWHRLVCLLLWHDWQEIPSGLRTCRRCGVWERYEPDPGGWLADVWVDF